MYNKWGYKLVVLIKYVIWFIGFRNDVLEIEEGYGVVEILLFGEVMFFFWNGFNKIVMVKYILVFVI